MRSSLLRVLLARGAGVLRVLRFALGAGVAARVPGEGADRPRGAYTPTQCASDFIICSINNSVADRQCLRDSNGLESLNPPKVIPNCHNKP